MELSAFHLSSTAKLKTGFSQKENLKECTGFEEQKCARSIWRNVRFDVCSFSGRLFKFFVVYKKRCNTNSYCN